MDDLETMLYQYKNTRAIWFESFMSPAERISYIKDAAELQQLINSLKKSKKSVRTKPDDTISEFWQSIEKFFKDE